MKATVAAKRQEFSSLQEARQRQLTELQGRLAQLTTVYTSTHPSVMNVQQSIAALSGESPQMAALKTQADRLEAEYLKRQTAAEERIQEEELGPKHRDVGLTLFCLAEIYHGQSRLNEAELVKQRARGILGNVLASQGKAAKAAPIRNAAVETLRKQSRGGSAK